MFKKFRRSKFVQMRFKSLSDKFADFVQGRLQIYIDVVAEDVV